MIRTQRPACADFDDRCPAPIASIGTLGSAPMTEQNALLDGSEGCGLANWGREDLAEPEAVDGRIELRETGIANTEIGACVQVRDYDLETIGGSTVEYRNNRENIATTSFAAPDRFAPSMGER